MQKQVDILLDSNKIGYVQTDDADNNMGVYFLEEVSSEIKINVEKYINENYNKVVKNNLIISSSNIPSD